MAKLKQETKVKSTITEKLKPKWLSILSCLGSKIYPRWKVDQIHDDALLFRRIHFSHVKKTTENFLVPASSAFTDAELSCDCNSYHTAHHVKTQTGLYYKYPIDGSKKFKDPREYFIASLAVNEVRRIGDADETIKHDPIQYFLSVKGAPNNRAHTIVISNLEEKLKVKKRKLLCNSSKWEIWDENVYNELIAQRA